MHPLKCVCDGLYKKHIWNTFIKKTRCISPTADKEPILLSEYIIKSRRVVPDSSQTTLTSKIIVCPRALVTCIGSRRWETMLATYEKMGWGEGHSLGQLEEQTGSF